MKTLSTNQIEVLTLIVSTLLTISIGKYIFGFNVWAILLVLVVLNVIKYIKIVIPWIKKQINKLKQINK